MVSTTSSPPKQAEGGFRVSERVGDNITGWLFIAPAVLLIGIFGIFPILYAAWMSLHGRRTRPDQFFCTRSGEFVLSDCFANYNNIVGDWGGAFLFVFGIIIIVSAYWVWAGEKNIFTKSFGELNVRQQVVRATLPVLLLIATFLFGRNILNLLQLGAIGEMIPQLLFALASIGIAFWLLAFAHEGTFAKHPRDREMRDGIIRTVLAFIVLGVGMFFTAQGYGLMISTGNEDFVRGLSITFYYAFGSIPLQLILALILAYVLYQNIRGKEIFRMIFFLPYVTPSVAAAVIFGIIFNARGGLANSFLESMGLEALKWTQESDSAFNIIFGTNLEGFIAGPSLALVTIVILGIWTYTGYNAVIFLAGLGQIPNDLYEAAKVDGANSWHLFRNITLPLLSPITFYLSVLGFIGTFKAFNTIFVMRQVQAFGTVDTASIVVYDTFKVSSQYGMATAQAILLFLVILGLTQVQRTFFENKVFYG